MIGILALFLLYTSTTALALTATQSLPVLHNYDHCPFCVRVRFALGINGVKHRLNFLPNDDIETPTLLIGKKIAPIFEYVPPNSAPDASPIIMGESLDIVALVDGWSPASALAPASSRTDIKAWQKSVQTTLRLLQRPRYVASPMIPEFHQRAGREAFALNHQLPPWEKPQWKGTEEFVSNEEKLKMYADAVNSPGTPALIKTLNEKLVELEGLICCKECCTEGGVSYDDVDLWSRLRSITIIKGAIFPPKVRAYLDYFEEKVDVPLYDSIAI